MPKVTTSRFACPQCGAAELRVLRTTSAAGCILRRRVCATCGKRLTTVERPIHSAPATGSGLLKLSIGQIRASLDLLADLSSDTNHTHGE